jgi:hypothetical protein
MKGSKPDEYIRRPMQWTSGPFSGFTSGTAWFPLNSNYASFNVNTLKADTNSIWHHYRKLIQLRNSEKALRTGIYKSIFSDNAKTFAFIRQKEEEQILSLINCGADTISSMSLSVSNANLSSGVYLATDLLSGKSTYVEITTGLAITGLSMLPFETKLLKLSIASGIMDARNEMIIQLYPNPAEEYFDLSVSEITNNIDVKIFDLTGALVENTNWETLEGQTKRIQIANLKDGIYLVQLKDKNKQKTIRFVKTGH